MTLRFIKKAEEGVENEATSGITRLQSVEEVTIFECKKDEILVIDDMTLNKASNNSRQVYDKVPGLNIWQSDDAEIQTTVGGQRLSPKCNSNFINTRQNGYDLAADALSAIWDRASFQPKFATLIFLWSSNFK